MPVKTNPNCPWYYSYVMALVGVGLMFLLRLALDPILGTRQPYIFCWFAVTTAAWFWGWRPGALAAVISCGLGFWAFVPPKFELAGRDWVDVGSLALVAALGFMLILMIEMLRRARTRAEANERKLQERVTELRTLLNLAPIAIWFAHDRECSRVTGNRLAHQLLGLGSDSRVTPRKAESSPAFAVQRDQKALAANELPLQQACASGRPMHNVEHEVLRPDGRTASVLVNAVPLLDEEGRVRGGIATALDITERKKNEQNIRAGEARFRVMADHVPVMVWIVDPTRRCTWCNRTWLEFTGRSMEQEAGDGWTESLHKDDQNCCLKRYAEAFAARRSFQMEYRLRRHDGEYRWLLARGVPLAGPDAEFTGFIGSCIDIHERKRTEEALRESEERLRSAIEAGRLGAWDWDIVNNRIHWSERLYEFHGLKPGGFDGTVEAFVRLVHPDDVSRLREAIQRALNEQVPYEIELRVVWPDGTIRWLATSARVIFDAAGKPLRMLGGTIDLTERKNTELALREAQWLLAQEATQQEDLVAQRTHELRSSLQDMENLCYTIAHDLRAPLRAMQGFARALNEDYQPVLDATAQDYTTRIMKAALRMDALITDLLAFGRLGMGELTLLPVELDTVIDGFLSDYAEEIKARRAVICVERLLPVVTANNTLLNQVVANLLLNAMKFVAPEVTPEIRVFAEDRGESARLCVEDNGIGIHGAHVEKLFHVFQRLHTQEQYPGTGIGLAIVKKAVERMGGTVGLASVPGRGSVFWIELPKAVAKLSQRTGKSELAQ